MHRVIYSPKARADLKDIVAYISRDNPFSARKWLERIRHTCDLLATQPGMGELREEFDIPRCRSFSFGTYVIYFRPIDGGIELVRVIHGSRDGSRL